MNDITYEKTSREIKRLKNNQAPGIDEISAELLKKGKNTKI
jgi:hypothetical protein